MDGILGIQARLDGLHIAPCLPVDWEKVSVRRNFRGCTYQIEIRNPDRLERGQYHVWLDGSKLEGNVLPPHQGACAGVHTVLAVLTASA